IASRSEHRAGPRVDPFAKERHLRASTYTRVRMMNSFASLKQISLQFGYHGSRGSFFPPSSCGRELEGGGSPYGVAPSPWPLRLRSGQALPIKGEGKSYVSCPFLKSVVYSAYPGRGDF